MMLYYDTEHLAQISESKALAGYSPEELALATHPDGYIKQPYFNRLETSNMRSSKVANDLLVPSNRANIYGKETIFEPDNVFDCAEEADSVRCWIGRGQFNHRQTRKAVGR